MHLIKNPQKSPKGLFKGWRVSIHKPELEDYEKNKLALVQVKKGLLFTVWEVRTLPPKFVPMKELVNKFTTCKLAQFNSKGSKSKLTKVYIDGKQYITRTAGKLKIKNKGFKTNLSWLKKYLIDNGLKNTTPPDWKDIK